MNTWTPGINSAKRDYPRLRFFSKLTGSGITTEDYEHAQKVWKEFNIQKLGEYHDLYLRTDVLLLANVFEEFRTTCIKGVVINYNREGAEA